MSLMIFLKLDSTVLFPSMWPRTFSILNRSLLAMASGNSFCAFLKNIHTSSFFKDPRDLNVRDDQEREHGDNRHDCDGVLNHPSFFRP